MKSDKVVFGKRLLGNLDGSSRRVRRSPFSCLSKVFKRLGISMTKGITWKGTDITFIDGTGEATEYSIAEGLCFNSEHHIVVYKQYFKHLKRSEELAEEIVELIVELIENA